MLASIQVPTSFVQALQPYFPLVTPLALLAVYAWFTSFRRDVTEIKNNHLHTIEAETKATNERIDKQTEAIGTLLDKQTNAIVGELRALRTDLITVVTAKK